MRDFFSGTKERDYIISLEGFQDKTISAGESVAFAPFLSKARIAFIDSGFQEITEGIFLVKIFSGIWQENKKIKTYHSEFFFKASDGRTNIQDNEDKEFTDAIVEGINKENLAESIEAGAISFLLERLESGDVIVRDGSLDSPIFRKLMDESRKKQILLMGLSKSSSISTKSGELATDLILEQNDLNSKESAWYLRAFSDDYKDIVFAKLNPLSRFCFRLDIAKIPGLDMKHAVEIIASNAIDPTFIGYPYGLVDCDMNARVTNEECDFHHLKINMEFGLNLRKKREDSHFVLDNMKF